MIWLTYDALATASSLNSGLAVTWSSRTLLLTSARTKELLKDALQLTIEERASLASELIASIDGESDQDAERAWAAEIERCARRAIASESRGTDWDTVQARIASKLTSP